MANAILSHKIPQKCVDNQATAHHANAAEELTALSQNLLRSGAKGMREGREERAEKVHWSVTFKRFSNSAREF